MVKLSKEKGFVNWNIIGQFAFDVWGVYWRRIVRSFLLSWTKSLFVSMWFFIDTQFFELESGQLSHPNYLLFVLLYQSIINPRLYFIFDYFISSYLSPSEEIENYEKIKLKYPFSTVALDLIVRRRDVDFFFSKYTMYVIKSYHL